MIGITLDVQQEKENELRLKQDQERLLEAQEQAGIGSFIWDVESGTIEASPNFYKNIRYRFFQRS